MITNVNRLLIARLSKTITDGRTIFEVLNAIKCGEISSEARAAHEWVTATIAAVRGAHGGGDLGDDEQIAGLILERLERLKKGVAR